MYEYNKSHYEQRLVEITDYRQKAINTIPNFMDSPKHLIIENIKENVLKLYKEIFPCSTKSKNPPLTINS